MKKVGLIMGSISDFDIVKECISVLKEFGIEYEAVVASAHRTPEKTAEWTKAAKDKNYGVIIAFAGAAAHLAGVVAAETNVPVVAVPISATSLNGVDALLSMVQMPGGIPVAVMAIGKAGAKNAGLFACQLQGVYDEDIYIKLQEYRKKMKDKIEKDNEILEQSLENL